MKATLMILANLLNRRTLLSLILISLGLLLIFSVQAMHEGHGGGGGPNGQPNNEPMVAMSTTPCVDGHAGTFPCRNVDLVSLLPLNSIGGLSGINENVNDVWGWTDPQTGKEYAIVGLASGTSFVDISTPASPIYLGKLPAHSVASTWRGIKVYQNHAFIVSEAANHGMQVFNLTQLRNVANPPVVFTETAHYNGFDRAHTLALNEETGFAYAAGSQAGANTCGRSLHIVDVRNPATPTFAGCVLPIAPDTYTHEAQCLTYRGPDTTYQGHEICFNSNDAATSSGPAALTIVDVTNKSNPVTLSRTTYPGSAFAHQGWLTGDYRHFLLDDEIDEQTFHHNSKTYIFDVSDLNAPVVKTPYLGTTPAIDHNQYIRGNYSFQSNYRAGLRIVNLTNVATSNLTEEAFFDIYPIDDTPQFNGAWSNYPFFQSGLVIVGGIEQGLFVLRPTSLSQPATGTISLSSSTYSGNENTASISVTVTRTGDTSGAAAVNYATGGGTATAGQDYTAASGTLNFAAGETMKTVNVQLLNDNIFENGNETFNFTLSNATGATLGTTTTAVVTIVDNDSKPGIGFDGPTIVVEPTSGTTSAVYTISLINPTVQTVTIDFATANGSALAGSDYVQTSGTLTFNPLETTKTFTVQINADGNGEPDENFFIDLTNIVNAFTFSSFHIPVTIIEAPNGAFHFSSSGYTVQENVGNAVVTVLRSGGTAGTTTVSYEMVNFTATAGQDYTASSGTLTFNPGETTKNINIPIIDDAQAEGSEAFRVEFRVATGGAEFASPITTGVLIVDNDGTPPTPTPTPTPQPTPPGDVWLPIALTANQVEIDTWRQSDGNTYAKVKLTFPDAGYRVQDQNWGTVVRTGNDITVSAVVEKTNSSSVQAQATTAHIYNLGPLADGQYTFNFRTFNQPTASETFTVSSAPPPANPIDDAAFFVTKQYEDFLGRQPDAAGLAFWTDNITKCNDPARRPPGQTVAQCIDLQRVTTSAAFFLSPEFQYTGYYIYRVYKGALGRAPYFSEFTQAQAIVGQNIVNSMGQLDANQINANKLVFAALFVLKPEFIARYGSLNNQDYVLRLFETTGVTPTTAQRDALIAELNNAAPGNQLGARATVLWKIVDGIIVISEGNQLFTTTYGQAFYNQQFNAAFVHMEYFGYMKRDPDAPGYAFWLGKLNTFGNYIDAEMVRSFIVSPEYRARFGAP